MADEKKSPKLEAAERAWYAAEAALQEAARAATAEFLCDGDQPQRRGWKERKLQTVACDFAKVHEALMAVLREES